MSGEPPGTRIQGPRLKSVKATFFNWVDLATVSPPIVHKQAFAQILLVLSGLLSTMDFAIFYHKSGTRKWGEPLGWISCITVGSFRK